MWNTEVPQILLSGSWDCTVRIWNVAKNTCLKVIHAHAAEVYGLCALPSSPLCFMSTSRDNTMRFWSIDDAVADIKWLVFQALAQGDGAAAAKFLFDGNVDPTALTSPERALAFSGPLSKALARTLIDPRLDFTEKWHRALSFFSPFNATDELWNAVKASKATTLTRSPQSLTIYPQAELLKLAEVCLFAFH
jgi:WD40 repeat protein